MLYDDIKIGNLIIKNRLFLPPMATKYATSDGYVTDKLLEYYDEKTKGDYLSLVITEHTYIRKDGKASLIQLGIYDDNQISGLNILTDVIHKNGSKVFCQLAHAGLTSHSANTGLPILAPSTLPHPRKEDFVGDPLTADGITRLVDDYVKAAKRAQKANYDGVEIHAAHGYLLSQFYSPLTNNRTDEFGGSLENRLRLHTMIIKSIKKSIPNFVVGIRFGAFDFMEGGSKISEIARASKILEEAGADFIDVSGGLCSYRNPDDETPGYFSELSKIIKGNVSIPVLLAGGFKKKEDIIKSLDRNDASMIGVGRAILIDSDWHIKEQI